MLVQPSPPRVRARKLHSGRNTIENQVLRVSRLALLVWTQKAQVELTLLHIIFSACFSLLCLVVKPPWLRSDATSFAAKGHSFLLNAISISLSCFFHL